jgi:hypothetical protein
MSWRVGLILATLLVLGMCGGALWHATVPNSVGPCIVTGTGNGLAANPSAECTAARAAQKRSTMLIFGAGAAVVLVVTSMPLVIERRRSWRMNRFAAEVWETD